MEAARAGEAGMGFAVVADEVRNLAQRCSQAAKDTALLIEESITRSTDGKGKVDQVAESIRVITEESSHVRTLVDEVNLGSEEQARGIDQIGKTIVQMEQVTQRVAANAEEGASAAAQLNAQSDLLKGLVQSLTSMVGGGYATRVQVKRVGISPVAHSYKAPARPLKRAALLKPSLSKKPAAAPSQFAIDAESFPMEESFKEF